jgi:hypothetical protein
LTTLAQTVRRRAGGRCEFCRLPEEATSIPFEIDHVIPRVHGGPTVSANLCLACYPCNRFKGANLSGVDPETGRVTVIFRPRSHRWGEHFRWEGPVLVGRTAIGRTTIEVLRINSTEAIEQREGLIDEGRF